MVVTAGNGEEAARQKPFSVASPPAKNAMSPLRRLQRLHVTACMLHAFFDNVNMTRNIIWHTGAPLLSYCYE